MSFFKTKIQEAAIKLFTSGASKFLLYGGSRSGKSFIIVFAMIIIACKFPGSRHLIARFRFNHVKNSIWLDTLKKCLKLCFPALKVVWNNQDYFITLPNGSEIWIGGLDDKDRAEKILGMEFLTVFLNEASQISYEAYTTLLTRLAQKIEGAKNMLFIDENPPSKKHWTYKIFIEHKEPTDNVDLSFVDQYGILHMNPEDNLDNISQEYIALLNSLPKRKRERFLAGLFSDDSEFALWEDAMISGTRISLKDLPDLRRIVVAIDPAVSATDTSDETGLVVAGVGFNDHFYVLEDASGKYTPTQWAKKAILLHKKWQADRIVGEVNNGGDLVETVLRNIDKTIPYKAVHATRNKTTRAEPIAAVYEQAKAHHVGEHPDLELEMTTWEGKKGEKSPNRIDALVWAGTELEVANIREEAEFGWDS
jgi:hypothetical protein